MTKLEVIGLSLILVLVLLTLVLFILKKKRHDEILKRVNKVLNETKKEDSITK